MTKKQLLTAAISAALIGNFLGHCIYSSIQGAIALRRRSHKLLKSLRKSRGGVIIGIQSNLSHWPLRISQFPSSPLHPQSFDVLMNRLPDDRLKNAVKVERGIASHPGQLTHS